MDCFNCGAPATTTGPVALCERCAAHSRSRGINFQRPNQEQTASPSPQGEPAESQPPPSSS